MRRIVSMAVVATLVAALAVPSGASAETRVTYDYQQGVADRFSGLLVAASGAGPVSTGGKSAVGVNLPGGTATVTATVTGALFSLLKTPVRVCLTSGSSEHCIVEDSRDVGVGANPLNTLSVPSSGGTAEVSAVALTGGTFGATVVRVVSISY